MVKTLISQADHIVTVIANTEDTARIISSLGESIASDAFDFAAQALGYFRFAIQEMTDVTSIEIQVDRNGECIELTEIKREVV